MIRGVRSFAAAAAIAVSSLAVAPALAGPAEMDLLSGYVGNWKGNGVMVGGQQPEPFRCRMQVQKGNQAKVNFAGRCTLVNFNLSVSGTIAFNDKTRRYEAAMSSNAGFSGVAAGRIDGERITFTLPRSRSTRVATTCGSARRWRWWQTPSASISRSSSTIPATS